MTTSPIIPTPAILGARKRPEAPAAAPKPGTATDPVDMPYWSICQLVIDRTGATFAPTFSGQPIAGLAALEEFYGPVVPLRGPAGQPCLPESGLRELVKKVSVSLGEDKWFDKVFRDTFYVYPDPA